MAINVSIVNQGNVDVFALNQGLKQLLTSRHVGMISNIARTHEQNREQHAGSGQLRPTHLLSGASK